MSENSVAIFELYPEHCSRQYCDYFAFYLDAIVGHISRLNQPAATGSCNKEPRVFHISPNSQVFSLQCSPYEIDGSD